MVNIMLKRSTKQIYVDERIRFLSVKTLAHTFVKYEVKVIYKGLVGYKAVNRVS